MKFYFIQMKSLDAAGSEMSLFEHRLLVLRQDLQSCAQQVMVMMVMVVMVVIVVLVMVLVMVVLVMGLVVVITITDYLC